METYLLSKDIVKQNYYETALTVCPTIPTCTTHTHVYSVKTSFHSHVIFVTQLNVSYGRNISTIRFSVFVHSVV